MEGEAPPLADLRAVLYEWRQLEGNVGWQRLREYARAQVARRVGEILHGETTELVDLVRRENVRGECAGIELFIAMPEVEIARLEHEISVRAERTIEMENDDDTENPDESPAP
jgi:hypothetical protein